MYKFWQPINFVLYFCSFVKQPEGYKPKNLPYGKYLQGNGILTDLQKVFEYFLKNVDRLLNMGSTQANESFNNIVASKHPKNRFYGGSESTAFRVAAAVSQKNIGHDALSKVYWFVCSYVYVYEYS